VSIIIFFGFAGFVLIVSTTYVIVAIKNLLQVKKLESTKASID